MESTSFSMYYSSTPTPHSRPLKRQENPPKFSFSAGPCECAAGILNQMVRIQSSVYGIIIPPFKLLNELKTSEVFFIYKHHLFS